jgi:acyl-CoA synthetase (NDP forming)/RimJ/RimL family protein N-acetyltransferase
VRPAAGGGGQMTTPGLPPTYALLADGSTVEIRAARPQDYDAVRDMHANLSPGNAYFRFFNLSPRAPDREAQRVCRPADDQHAALLALLGGQLVGVATYEPADRPGRAEIAFAVSDDMHGRGIATLLLEHLVSQARQRNLVAFQAETLPDNYAMQGVFADAGLPVERQFKDGVIELTFPLPAADSEGLDSYLDAVSVRAGTAEVASLRYLFEPASVAVVGAGRQRGTVGREILHNIVTGGFGGQVHAVNPSGGSMEGIACLGSALELPADVDVAVIAVPPGEVAEVAASCGQRGVRTLVVITAGLGGSGPELLAICRRYGMRLVGPNCFGIAAPAIGLNATFAADPPVPGVAGLVMQSGGIGIALLEHFGRLGIGVSSFASVGDKYDVSSNDLLTWWEQDERTRLAVLYVESFGNPRAFARTARRVGRKIPVLTIIGGRSAAGQRAAASHTAASATPLVTQEALFGQAGIIATRSLGELVEAAALLSCQPLPAGGRVAIVSNAGGTGVLAADACGDVGLTVAVLSGQTQQRLAGLLPSGAAISGPVDATAGVGADAFRACLEEVAADKSVDAVVAIGVRTALVDLSSAITTAKVDKPMAVALLDQAESVRLLSVTAPASDGRPGAFVPAYSYPESAVRALGHAAGYRRWRDSQRGRLPDLAGLDAAGGRSVVASFLARHPGGGWLAGAEAERLLASYRIPVAARVTGSSGAAVAAAADAGGPVVAGGVETVIGVVQEPVFGPLIVFGLGGVASEMLGDRIARLSPLTDADADDMIGGLRAAPLLTGHRGSPAVDTAGLADVLLRVSRLADELPEVVELDLNPVIARPRDVQVAGFRIRLAPAAPRDPFLRRLR